MRAADEQTGDAKQPDEGPGLQPSDQPGRRSGAGAESVADQMRKDQQRNSNERRVRDDDLPTPARDSTA
ncbi:hypothetical protein [Ramlibacter pallidus]|uniref:Uncharacterized protein n=1 Tax=Ramlibacter pallidus TaxID=2780087 RepID=A0ABR9S7Y8_9BURK|nr:hypothetical protein [Ramlibacter pallidus]MBE7369645.1 hypothetical protein [Ramlibacter pallidus]